MTERDELILMYRFYYHMTLERYIYCLVNQPVFKTKMCMYTCKGAPPYFCVLTCNLGKMVWFHKTTIYVPVYMIVLFMITVWYTLIII